jgi:DNA-binding PadR family transcriptional regulator
MHTPREVAHLLPLKPLVFEVLLALTGGSRHGWSLLREIRQRPGGESLMPGNFYRTLRRMLDDGVIREAGRRAAADGGDDGRRRYFQLTALGSAAAGAEARRLESLVLESRQKQLLSPGRRG